MKIFIKTYARAVFTAIVLAGFATAQTFLSFDCPLKAGFGFNATYYENGLPKCAAGSLAVTAPDGSTQNLQAGACAAGVHAFPSFEARRQGAYKLVVGIGSASKECAAAGIALRERQAVPEMHLGVAALAAFAALAVAGRRFPPRA